MYVLLNYKLFVQFENFHENWTFSADLLVKEYTLIVHVGSLIYRNESVFGNGKLWKTGDHFTMPHKNSCYYICQHCLVHLGDIARYRNQNRQAEIFYRFVDLWTVF